MRFFAFLCIFLHHALSRSVSDGVADQVTLRSTFAGSAKFAVSLFFLLSGYLISTLLVIEKERTGRVHIADFYKRRIARIWPLYYAFTVLVLIVATGVSRLRPSAGALAASTFFAGNWFLILGGANFVGGLGILWSVNIEEQFYLLWPLVANYCNRRCFLLVSAATLVTSYLVLIGFAAQGIASDAALRFNTLVEMQFFAAGALLAICLPRQGPSIPPGLRLLLASVGLFLWMAGFRLFGNMVPGLPTRWWMPAALYACILAGCIVIFLGFLGFPSRFIPSRILWLGKISYGLYVYHSLVLALTPPTPAVWRHRAMPTLVRFCLELSITIVLAGLSYRWLERPFLRWKERITFVPNRSD